MTTLTIHIPDEMFERLKSLADAENVSIEQVVINSIHDLTDDEPTHAEILASIRKGMIQALNGEGRPARAVLDEIDREYEAENAE
jgi:predicted transcriptional regulator